MTLNVNPSSKGKVSTDQKMMNVVWLLQLS